jgi:hypothetical protein
MACEGITIETTTLDEVIEVGVVGPQGPAGAAGVGVPTGGITGYVLAKASTADYDTEWVAQTGGGGNFSSPPPIGDVTPNTGYFTTISASGIATLPHIHGSLAGNLYVHVKNTSGSALSRGTPVYIVGNVGASDRVEVAAADYDDPTKMPAVGLLETDLAQNGDGNAIIVGELLNANTSAYALNSELYVGNNGTLTATPPINPPAIIQTVGIVSRVQSNTGIIVVNMQGKRDPAEQALEYRSVNLFASGNYNVAQGRRTYLTANFASAFSTYTVTLPRMDANDNAKNGDELYVLLSLGSANSNCIFRQYQYTGSLPYSGSFSTILDVPNASNARLFRFRLRDFVWSLEPIYNMAAPPSIGEVTPNAGYFSPLYAVDSDGIGNGRVKLSADGVTSGATRTASFPDKDITLDDVNDPRSPTAHQTSHQAGGSDQLSTYDLPSLLGNALFGEDIEYLDGVVNSLGTAAFANLGINAGEAAEGNHTHQLDQLQAASSTLGQVLTSNGDGTASWEDAAGSDATKTYGYFVATQNQPILSSFATLDTRNSIAILDFDDATTESATFVGIMPTVANLLSGLIVNIWFTMTTATSGNVRWLVMFERGNTDLDVDSFDVAVEQNVAVASTSGVPAVASLTITTIDGITAGDLYRVRVQRIGGNVGDTAVGDAELIAVEIRSAA